MTDETDYSDVPYLFYLLGNERAIKLREDVGELIDDAKADGLERKFIVDVMWQYTTLHKTPSGEESSREEFIRYVRQLRSYRDDIQQTLDIMEQLLDLDPIKATS